MDVKYTQQQRRAIEMHDQNLLVSAAAGSGKTAVLAERCVALIRDPLRPCDADQLLVLTYTNAAAAEMRQRITGLLNTAAIQEPQNERLQKQVLLLAGAQISTLHSFCATMLRRYFHELGIDPAFRLMEQDETTLMMADVAEALVERRLLDPHAIAFGRLVEHYAGGSPSRIADVILKLYSQQSSLLDPSAWLAERRKWIDEAVERPLDQSRLGGELLSILSKRLDTLISSGARLEAALRTQPEFGKYADHVRALHTLTLGWLDAMKSSPFDDFARDISDPQLPRLPTLKPVPPDKEAWQARINTLADGIKKFAKDGVLRFTEASLQRHLGETTWAIDTLVGLVEEFWQDFSRAKHDAGALDFSDLERYALRLLRGDDGEPTAAALAYRRQFRHVLVDEYQDVNELQDTLLTMLADESAGNLFTVGDIKQSIYRFRQADPERFKQRYVRYKRTAGSGEVIDLQQNFRSRGPLLEVLNAIFERLMTAETADVNYNATQRLVPAAKFPSDPGLFTGTPVELHVVEKDPSPGDHKLEADEREAVLIAGRLKQLLGLNGEPAVRVAERGAATRPAKPSDVAILLRAMRIKAERFATILRNAGIPVQADSTTGFFAATEVQDVLATLRAIDNSRSDYDIAGYLRSPLCGLDRPEDALAEIRLGYPHAVFHEAVQIYVRERSDAVALEVGWSMARLDGWAIFAQQHSVAELIQRLLDETSYDVYVAGLVDGPQRAANLAELLRRARSFERFRRPTLSRFLRYIATIQDQGDLGMPPADGQARDAVRVMSVHKSKGLEFPIVVVPDLGKEHNLRDSGGLILVDETVGLALKTVDAEREAHFPSLASVIASEHIRRRSLAEEMRVLYVATTRAREHLILVGTELPAALEEWDSEWRGHAGPLPAGAVLAGRSMLEWVGPAAALAEAAAPGSIDRQEHTVEEIEKLAASLLGRDRVDEKAPPLQRLQPIEPAVEISRLVRQAVERITYQYPHAVAAATSATISVTDLAKTGQTAPGGESVSRQGVVKFDRLLRRPRFLTIGEPLSAADAGAVTHAVLQRLDFARTCDPADLEAQITKLVERKFVTEEDAARVDLPAILWFLETDLGRRFRSSPAKLLRELDVVYAVQMANTTDAGDRVMVRGRLDVALADSAGLTLVDYKTDRVTPETVAARAAFYQPQISAYRTQLGLLTQTPVNEAWLVFLSARVLHRA